MHLHMRLLHALEHIIASETVIWTCCVGDLLHKYTEILVGHVCTRSSPAFAVDQEISIPLIPCSVFMGIIAKMATATCTCSMLRRLLQRRQNCYNAVKK